MAGVSDATRRAGRQEDADEVIRVEGLTKRYGKFTAVDDEDAERHCEAHGGEGVRGGHGYTNAARAYKGQDRLHDAEVFALRGFDGA